MRYKVYLDVIFLVNVCMDFALLLLLKFVMHYQGRWVRLILGAVSGGTISCFLSVWLSRLPLLIQFLLYYLCATVMVSIAFYKLPWKALIKCSIELFVLTWLYSGTAGWIYEKIKCGFDIEVLPLVFSLFIGGILIVKGERFLELKKTDGCIVEYEVDINGKKKSGRGFLDSGNGLYEPMSGKMVIIVSAAWGKELLSEQEQKIVLDYVEKGEWNLEEIRRLDKSNFLAVPYQTVGKKRSILIALKSNRICLKKDREYEYTDVVLAFSKDIFQDNKKCDAILHREMF